MLLLSLFHGKGHFVRILLKVLMCETAHNYVRNKGLSQMPMTVPALGTRARRSPNRMPPAPFTLLASCKDETRVRVKEVCKF